VLVKEEVMTDARFPNEIRERAGVEDRVWDTQPFQLGLNARLLPEHPLRLSLRYVSEIRRDEQLDPGFLCGLGDLSLNLEGRSRNRADDNIYARQCALDGLGIGIVNRGHLGVTFDRGFGALSAQKSIDEYASRG